ncbi:MAG: nitrogen fixation protein NifQ [Gammaproteobacteria bacterium]|jgi:nitrogen fixation protein NifQ
MNRAMSDTDAVHAAHAYLMSFAQGRANDDALACMLASNAQGHGALPLRLGLSAADHAHMIDRHFPGACWSTPQHDTHKPDPQREEERGELRRLLLVNCAGSDESERWIADIVTAACMGGDHLWQDLGLWARTDLTELMRNNFPALAARNDRDMKWKKFLYKQLCVQEGIYTCRSPSCEVCPDYHACFGPED